MNPLNLKETWANGVVRARQQSGVALEHNAPDELADQVRRQGEINRTIAKSAGATTVRGGANVSTTTSSGAAGAATNLAKSNSGRTATSGSGTGSGSGSTGSSSSGSGGGLAPGTGGNPDEIAV